MKRNLLFILMMLVSMMGTRIAVNAQNLTLSDVQNSGCQRGNQRRANENETQRTIVLLKEGNILSVQILGFVSNCATMGFDITPSISGGSDGTPVSVSLNVEPILPDIVTTCECPFNVSFTLHGLEANSFYFSCWWYEGQVSLTDGEPLTLESITVPAQIGEWYCIIDKVNHTAIVEGVDGGISELLIPWVLYYEGEHYFVTGIDEDAFLNYKALASVTLPPNLTRIGDLAFAYCDNLTDVYCYADNAPTTGSNVFKGTPIASATLHAPAGSIEMYKATAPWNEFGNIVGEGEVTIDGLNYYLNSSFYTAPLTKGNTWEGELDIPSEVSFYGQAYTVTSMGLSAFFENEKLTNVRIPKTLNNILRWYYTTNPYEEVPTGLVSSDHMNPFRGCTALESIEVDEENPSLKSVDGVLFSQDGKGHYYYLTNDYYGTGLYCYPAGARRESYTIPDGVEWIGSGAFDHNQYISTLTIPSSLKQICNNVFAGCNNLKDIYCYAENVPIAFSEAFKDFSIASATLHVPAGSVEKYKATSPWSSFGNIVAIEEIAQEYFPEGTKWTEIRLDTLKYDSWYSKIGDEWVPNFETIDYRVQGEYIDERYNDRYSCIYTNGQEWTDSLTLLLYDHRIGDNNVGWCGEVTVAAFDDNGQLFWPYYGQMYPLSWEAGTTMSSLNILIAGATSSWPWEWDEYGTVEEIKEGNFGGVRPLKYSDVNGIRFIQGIGVASWNDGECIFGPIRPYEAFSAFDWNTYPYPREQQYRSMLVHFERDNEVLYDVWPQKGCTATVTIDGLNYFLNLNGGEAVIADGNNCSGELDIPSEVSYNGETYVVKSMFVHSFYNNTELTKVRIPKTIENILHSYPYDSDDEDPPTGMVSPDHMNPFRECTALEAIEVDEENPSFKTINGVLFSQDGVGHYYYLTNEYYGTGLYCYPAGRQQEAYSIPDGVEWIGANAFEGSRNLTTLTIPNSITHIYSCAFQNCNNLTDVYCYADNVPITWDYAFKDTPIASATLHVPAGSVEKYKAASSWNEFGNIVATGSSVTFTKDQMATIILPTEPDASKGKYYRLDRVEGNEIIFEQELHPRAHVPYIIVPSEDFSIELSAQELEGLTGDTVSVDGISFIGTYHREEIDPKEGFYIEIIDTTPDCSLSNDRQMIGALRAYLLVTWDDPYNHGGTKVPTDRMEIVLHNNTTGIKPLSNSPSMEENIYDLNGINVNNKSSNRKLPHGIYIKDGRKEVIR